MVGWFTACRKEGVLLFCKNELGYRLTFGFKDRCALLSGLVSRLEPSALHVIPVLIPEAVLGTKEPSDKARTAAFDLILAMGRKMSEGGIVKRDMIDGMEEEHSQAGKLIFA